MDEEDKKKDPKIDVGFNVQVSKQTSALGAEVVTITANAPKNASGEDLNNLLRKIFLGIDRRVDELNAKVLARQEELKKPGAVKTLEDLEREVDLSEVESVGNS